MLLSREAILGADDIETREVDVPEWGGTVRLKALTGKERDSYEASCMEQRGNQVRRNILNARAKLVVRSIVDENGVRIFTDQDASALGQKSAAVLDRLFEIAADMSGLTEADVEELAKNSESDLGDGSTSI